MNENDRDVVPIIFEGEDRVGNVAQNIAGQLDKFGSHLEKIRVSFGATGLAAAGFLKTSFDSLNKLNSEARTLSTRIGSSIEEASKFIAVGEKMGVGADAISSAFTLFQRKLGNAGDAQEALEKKTEKYQEKLRKLQTDLAETTAKYNSLSEKKVTTAKEADSVSEAKRKLASRIQELRIQIAQEAKDMGNVQTEIKGFKGALLTLGIEMEDKSGKARPFLDVLGDIADKFKAMPDGPQKTALAIQLFGYSGTGMIPILNKGKEGIKEMGKEAEQLGLVITKADSDALKKITASTRGMGESFKSLQFTAIRPLVPWIGALSETVSGLASNIIKSDSPLKQFIGQGLGLVAIFGSLVGGSDVLSRVAQTIPGLSAIFSTFGGLFGKLGVTAAVVGAFAYAFEKNMFGLKDRLGPIFAALGKSFTQLFVDFQNAFKTGNWQKVFDDLGKIISLSFEVLKKIDIGRILGDIVTVIRSWVTRNGPTIASTFETLKTHFWNWLTGPNGVIASVATQLANLTILGDIVTTIRSWVTKNGPTIASTFETWKTHFWNWLTGPNGVIASAATQLANVTKKITGWIGTNWEPIRSQLIIWGSKFWEWLTGPGGAIDQAGNKLNSFIEGISGWLDKNSGPIFETLNKWGTKMWDWIAGEINPKTKLREGGAIGKMLDSMVKWAESDEGKKKLASISDAISDVITKAFNLLFGDQKGNIGLLETFARALGGAITKAIELLFGDQQGNIGLLETLARGLQENIPKIAKLLWAIGESIMAGIAKGMIGFAGAKGVDIWIEILKALKLDPQVFGDVVTQQGLEGLRYRAKRAPNITAQSGFMPGEEGEPQYGTPEWEDWFRKRNEKIFQVPIKIPTTIKPPTEKDVKSALTTPSVFGKGAPEITLDGQIHLDFDKPPTLSPDAQEKMKDAIRGGGSAIGSGSAPGGQGPKEIILPFGEELGLGLSEGFMNGITSGTASLWPTVQSAVGEGIATISMNIDSFVTDWGKYIGQSFATGIEEGFNSMIGGITESITRMLDTIIETIKTVMAIASPSKVTADEIGVPLGEGVGVGIQRGMKSIVGDIAGQTSLRQTGSGGGGNSMTITLQHNWPAGIDRLTREQFEQVDRETIEQVINRVFTGTSVQFVTGR